MFFLGQWATNCCREFIPLSLRPFFSNNRISRNRGTLNNDISLALILTYCCEIFINIKVLFFRCNEPKKEYTGLKYVSLIDSLCNNYFLLPEVLRQKFLKKLNEGKLANF